MDKRSFTRIAPILLLAFTINALGHPAGSGAKIQKAKLPADYTRDWARLEHIKFGNVSSISLELNRGQDLGKVTELQHGELNIAVNRIISMMRSDNFDAFHRILKEQSHGEIVLSPWGKKKFRFQLEGVTDMDGLSDLDLLEAFWIYRTSMGKASYYYVGYVPSESFYNITQLQALPLPQEYPNSFPKDALATGSSCQISSFELLENYPRDEIAANEYLLVADARVMLVVDHGDIAFPIAIRYWWCSKRAVWVPWFLTEYNSVGRRYMAVF